MWEATWGIGEFTKSCLLKILLCYFPMAAVTNFHKFSDLKQSQLIVLQFWTSKVQNGSHWTSVRCQQGCSGGSGGVCCLPSPASRGPTTPSLPGPTCSHVTVSAPVLSPPSLALTLCPSSVLSKMLGFSCTHTTTPESLPKSIFLI